MGKILVTGATGNVGKYVTEYLIKQARGVKAAGMHEEKARALFGEGAEYCRFDFEKPETFENALQDVDRVFIMRPPQMGNPEDFRPFIETMKKQNTIKLVVFLSLIGIEKNPAPPHHKIEKMLRNSGIPWCFVRPSFFMQNLSGVHAFEIKHFNRIVIPAGRALTSFVDAKDIGEISAKILAEPDIHINKAYDLTGPEALSYEEAAKIMSRELKKEIVYTGVSIHTAFTYWTKIRGLEKNYAMVMCMLYLMTRMGTARTVSDDFEKVMGKKPRSFGNFVRENREAW